MMRKDAIRRGRWVAAVMCVWLVGAACSGSTGDRVTPDGRPGDSRSGSGEVVTVVGRLTGEGVECQALRSDSGELYTLTGMPDGFATGDSVLVQGTVAEISFCMQGTALNVLRMEPR